MALKIQNENIKSSAELIADGGSAAQLPNDTKIYVTANSLNKTLYQAVVDGDLAGGGAGSPDTIFEINADNYTSLSGWATGDGTIVDGSALPGGTLQGTFELISTSPAEGTQHFRFTQAAGSLDTYFLSDAQTIPEIWRGKDVGCNVSLKYDGSDNDLYVIVWDATNNRRLTTADFYVKASTTYRNHQMVFTIPSSCTSIRVGFQVRALNSGKIINFDKFSLFDRPFVMANVNQECSFRVNLSATQNISSTASTKINFNTEAYDTKSAYDNATNYRFTVPVGLAGTYNFSAGIQAGLVTAGTYVILQLKKNGTTIAQIEDNPDSSTYISHDLSCSDKAVAGDYYEVFVQSGDSSYSISAGSNSWFSGELVGGAQVESVITPASSSLIYSAIITSGATIQTQGPENFISSVSSGGTGIYTINFTSGFFTTAPGVNLSINSNTAFSSVLNGAATTTSCEVRTFNSSNVATNSAFTITVTRQGDDAKSASRALVATPVDRICYLSDVKSSATAGGTFTSGAWQTRTLNTIDGDTSFCSLSSNQFTLSAGTYDIDASAPGYFCAAHKAKLYNVSLATDQILGSSEYAGANTTQSRSIVKGRFTLSSSTVFELRHRCSLTSVSDGFGTTSSFSVSEIYAMVSIKKIK